MLVAGKGKVEKQKVCDWCRKPAPAVSDHDLRARGWLVNDARLICDEHRAQYLYAPYTPKAREKY